MLSGVRQSCNSDIRHDALEHDAKPLAARPVWEDRSDGVPEGAGPAGPNIWANFPVLEAWVDLEALKDSPSDELPGFNDRLMAWLPTMIEHRCSVGERGGFFERLRRGHLSGPHPRARRARAPRAGRHAGRLRPGPRDRRKTGVYKVVIEYARKRSAAPAWRPRASSAWRPSTTGRSTSRPRSSELRDVGPPGRLGPSTARDRRRGRGPGHPRPPAQHRQPGQLGHGAQAAPHPGRRDRPDRRHRRSDRPGQGTDPRPARAPSASRCPRAGRSTTPTTPGRPRKRSALPVVVKPQFGNQGRGVATEPDDPRAGRRRLRQRPRRQAEIVVERSRRATTTGCWSSATGSSPPPAASRRRSSATACTTRRRAGRGGQQRPPPRRRPCDGPEQDRARPDRARRCWPSRATRPTRCLRPVQRVLIRRNANLSTGGTADRRDRLTSIPRSPPAPSRRPRSSGWTSPGSTSSPRDIGRPLEEQGGVVVEVNAGPGLRMHLEPSAGKPRPVGEAIVDTLFADGDDGRIPIVAVTGRQRQDDHHPADRPHAPAAGPTRRHDLHRRHLHRRPPDRGGRLQRPAERPRRAAEPDGRGGRARDGPRRHPPRGARVRPLRRRGRDQHRRGGPPGPLRHRDAGASWPRSSGRSSTSSRPTGAAVLKADDPLVAEMAPKCPGSVIFFCPGRRRPDGRRHRASRAAGRSSSATAR